MMEQSRRKQNFYMKQNIIKEVGGNPTVDELLTYMLGDDYSDGEYLVYRYEYSKRSLMNRVNMLWVYPTFLISMPFIWLFTGGTGVTRSSRIGRLIDYLVKFEH